MAQCTAELDLSLLSSHPGKGMASQDEDYHGLVSNLVEWYMILQLSGSSKPLPGYLCSYDVAHACSWEVQTTSCRTKDLP